MSTIKDKKEAIELIKTVIENNIFHRFPISKIKHSFDIISKEMEIENTYDNNTVKEALNVLWHINEEYCITVIANDLPKQETMNSCISVLIHNTRNNISKLL